MPKQNRPLVRDGRLQAPKKRTDRSYLRNADPAPPPGPTDDEATSPAIDAADDVRAAAKGVVSSPPVAQPAAAAPPPRLSASMRALQQQGVKKQRDFDVHGLAVRDSRYAIHELRRIAIVSAIIVGTLIVLAIVL